uniref:CD3 gamma/delta subunit Ig-like domain-containing protein n=1 Tax=Hucho hucho TaxID=62062 RepID=A0A4W5M8Z0_9TELE
MNRVNMNGVLIFFMLAITAVEGQESGECDKSKGIINGIVENEHYYCNSSTEIYQFHIKRKVCENGFELDVILVTGIIVGDLLLTGGVILIVYSWAQKKSRCAAPQKPTSRSAGHGPPVVPSPDYEPLSVATRSRDTYATHRTG